MYTIIAQLRLVSFQSATGYKLELWPIEIASQIRGERALFGMDIVVEPIQSEISDSSESPTVTEGISVAPVKGLDLDGKGVEIQGRELLMRKG